MKINLNDEEAEIRYATWVSMLIDLIKPANLELIAGCALGKTTDVVAKRLIDIIYDMPRSVISFVQDTYINAQSNIIPAIEEGWERNGFYRGAKYHYVIDEKPPDHWAKPVVPTSLYQHTIHTRNGVKFLIKSLDRPSVNAGISVQHIVADEVKLADFKKMKKVFPTLRGNAILFQKSHYFQGHTFTSDMPDTTDNEHDWVMGMEKNMNIRNIFDILQCAIVVNEIQYELYCANRDKEPEKNIENIKRNLFRWEERIAKLRRNSSFFYVVSSLANIDVLTFNYLVTQFNSMEENYEELKKAILSIKPSLRKDARFYIELSDKNFYADGYNYDYFDQYGITSNIARTSEGLKYINKEKPLEAGLDTGNMLSLCIGQDYGNDYRIVKNLYTIPPDWFGELAEQFRTFFMPHKRKQLLLYYDRSANNYSKVKADYANQFKNAVEKDKAGKSTGWVVRLMSLGQGNIEHDDEYNLMIQMMGNKNSKLPHLYIDKNECKELKSSLELAPAGKDSKGRIVKVKTSEKQKNLKRLPMESTNMSDAFKYLMCRKEFLRIAKVKRKVSFGSISTSV